MERESNSGVRTTDTSLALIEVMLDLDQVTVEDLQREMDLTASTIYRHLSTLQDRGYVINDGDSYRVSLKFLTIGGYLRRQVPGYSMIKTEVDNIAEITGERAQFIVREGDDRVYLYTETGENPVQTGARTGSRGPIHSSAAGKAIVAHLPERTRESLIDSLDLVKTGPNTISDKTELRENLEQIREQEYALNLQESTSGVHAIGAVVEVGDTIIGGLSVSGPATRLKRDRLENELVDPVRAASNELELHIEHSTSSPTGQGI